MLDLYDELAKIVDALDRAQPEFAVCGGVAMVMDSFAPQWTFVPVIKTSLTSSA